MDDPMQRVLRLVTLVRRYVRRWKQRAKFRKVLRSKQPHCLIRVRLNLRTTGKGQVPLYGGRGDWFRAIEVRLDLKRNLSDRESLPLDPLNVVYYPIATQLCRVRS